MSGVLFMVLSHPTLRPSLVGDRRSSPALLMPGGQVVRVVERFPNRFSVVRLQEPAAEEWPLQLVSAERVVELG